MSVCTFFGHKDTPQEIEPILKKFLLELIENKGADIFYVGNQGNFDTMVRKNLKNKFILSSTKIRCTNAHLISLIFT